jgi:hypothetical protein
MVGPATFDDSFVKISEVGVGFGRIVLESYSANQYMDIARLK